MKYIILLTTLLFMPLNNTAFRKTIKYESNDANLLAWYQFNDTDNLGKDSMGNYDLVAQNVVKDTSIGGISFKNNGYLYAPALNEMSGDSYTDFSDIISGSFSVSTRIYLRSNDDVCHTNVTRYLCKYGT